VPAMVCSLIKDIHAELKHKEMEITWCFINSALVCDSGGIYFH